MVKKNVSPSSSVANSSSGKQLETKKSNEPTVINASPSYFESIKQEKTLPFTNFLKSKRIAISAEPAQMKYNKNKDLQSTFAEHPKSEQ